jgi:hypothetical protein
LKNLLKFSLLTLALVLVSSPLVHASGPGFGHGPDPRNPPHHDPGPSTPSAPEVDPAMAMSGIALVAGAVAVMRMNKRK